MTLELQRGVTGDSQQADFTNGTLQTIPGHNLAFTVAVTVTVPAEVNTENALAHYLTAVFRDLAKDPEVDIHIITGPDEELNQ